MDRRQARKIGYLAVAEFLEELVNGNSPQLDAILANQGVAGGPDITKAYRAVNGIALSLRDRGRTMRATSGGGAPFHFKSGDPSVNGNPTNISNTSPTSPSAPTPSSPTPTPTPSPSPSPNPTISPTTPSYTPISRSYGRAPVTTQDLTSMVQATIDDFMIKAAAFTAHDVTTYLRKSHPTLEISHTEVRPIVRDIMASAVSYSGTYKTLPNGASAVMYEPDTQSTPALNSTQSVASPTAPTTAGGLTTLLLNNPS